MKNLLIFLTVFSAWALAIPVPNANVKPQTIEQTGTLSVGLRKRQANWNIERNELAECAPITVIFARGTIELGNVGSFAGPPFFNALDLALGAENVAVQGVDYPANIEGYLEGGDRAGASRLADLTNQAASTCPDTQIVLSGYSQGAQVVHLGEAQIPAEVAAKVAAVVLFGDPDKDQPLPNIAEDKIDTYCFPGDLICDGLPVVDTYHLSYSVDAVSAALFVKDHVKL